MPGIDHPYDVSIAWGVAEYKGLTQLSGAFHLADQAMYDMKRMQESGVTEEVDSRNFSRIDNANVENRDNDSFTL